MVYAARLATTMALAATVVPAVIAFVGNDVGCCGGRAIRPTTSSVVVVVGPLSAVASGSVADDSAARAMSEYMAKSHEEKLRAIKSVEDKKNSEIEVRERGDVHARSSFFFFFGPISRNENPPRTSFLFFYVRDVYIDNVVSFLSSLSLPPSLSSGAQGGNRSAQNIVRPRRRRIVVVVIFFPRSSGIRRGYHHLRYPNEIGIVSKIHGQLHRQRPESKIVG
jgi:hypothetical protein